MPGFCGCGYACAQNENWWVSARRERMRVRTAWTEAILARGASVAAPGGELGGFFAWMAAMGLEVRRSRSLSGPRRPWPRLIVLVWQFSFGPRPWGHLRGTKRQNPDVSCHDQPPGHSDRTKTATITIEGPCQPSLRRTGCIS